MLAPRPRYVLIAEADVDQDVRRWRFAIHNAATGDTLAACDEEPAAGAERLELIALVRGLEALDQPSEVAVVTRNASIARALQRGLSEWRNNHWRWESYGRLVPVRNADLWRRVDRALSIHCVGCKTWRLDAAETASPDDHEPLTPREAPLADHRRRVDAPTVLILPAARSRRRVRIAPRRVAAAAG